jgi:hypothetical protein
MASIIGIIDKSAGICREPESIEESNPNQSLQNVEFVTQETSSFQKRSSFSERFINIFGAEFAFRSAVQTGRLAMGSNRPTYEPEFLTSTNPLVVGFVAFLKAL